MKRYCTYTLEPGVIDELAIKIRDHSLEIVALDAFNQRGGQTEQNWKCFDKSGDLFFFCIGYSVLFIKAASGERVPETRFCLVISTFERNRNPDELKAAIAIFEQLLIQLKAKQED